VGRNLVDLGLNPAIIKVNEGSTSLAVDWNSQISGPWWNLWKSDALDALEQLTSGGDTVNLRGFFWLQGEADSTVRIAVGYALVNDVTSELAGAGYDTDDLNVFDGVHYDAALLAVTCLFADRTLHAQSWNLRQHQPQRAQSRIEDVQQAGYETAYVGKWHMGNDDSARPGFDHWVSMKGQGTSFDPVLNVNGHRSKHTGHTTDVLDAIPRRLNAMDTLQGKPALQQND